MKLLLSWLRLRCGVLVLRRADIFGRTHWRQRLATSVAQLRGDQTPPFIDRDVDHLLHWLLSRAMVFAALIQQASSASCTGLCVGPTLQHTNII